MARPSLGWGRETTKHPNALWADLRSSGRCRGRVIGVTGPAAVLMPPAEDLSGGAIGWKPNHHPRKN